MTTNEKEKKRIIDLIEKRDEFVTDVDGFVYWWPGENRGHLAAHHLRWIAEELDERNVEMEKHVSDYFKKLKGNKGCTKNTI